MMPLHSTAKRPSKLNDPLMRETFKQAGFGAAVAAGAMSPSEARTAAEKSVSHAANLPENPQKSAVFPWDKRRSSVLAALSSGTHFALSLAGDTPREMADRCIVSASTVRDMCGKRSVPNAYSLLLIGEQYPTVLDHWLALIGKRAVDL
jgi:hypothetical protein